MSDILSREEFDYWLPRAAHHGKMLEVVAGDSKLRAHDKALRARVEELEAALKDITIERDNLRQLFEMAVSRVKSSGDEDDEADHND